MDTTWLDTLGLKLQRCLALGHATLQLLEVCLRFRVTPEMAHGCFGKCPIQVGVADLVALGAVLLTSRLGFALDQPRIFAGRHSRYDRRYRRRANGRAEQYHNRTVVAVYRISLGLLLWVSAPVSLSFAVRWGEGSMSIMWLKSFATLTRTRLPKSRHESSGGNTADPRGRLVSHPYER